MLQQGRGVIQIIHSGVTLRVGLFQPCGLFSMVETLMGE